MGGRFLLKLNTYERPIANKYREGKMKRTLKRELKVREMAIREAMEVSRVASVWYDAAELVGVGPQGPR